jgi:predicted ATP-dependent serine protease
MKNIEINDEAEMIEDVFEDAASYAPDVMTVNSLNTYYAHDLNGERIQTEAGNPTQIRRIAKLTFKFAHGKNACKKLITTFLICQVDKDGGMIGPQEVAHAVDATFIAKKGSNGDDPQEFDKTGIMMLSTYNNKNRNGNARLKHRFRMDPETGILVPDGKLFM